MWYRLFRHLVIGPALWLRYRPRVVGTTHIPARGPVIIAANHSAVVDSLLLCLVIDRRLTFVAKSDYFDGPGLRGALQRWFFTAVGQIPVDRRGGEGSAAALTAARAVLAQGRTWAIHPEGTRSADESVHRGRTGVMRVSRDTQTPVIPIGLRGTGTTQRAGRLRWWPHRVEIVIGSPVAPPATATTTDGVRAATDALMDRIAILAGKPYDDTYTKRFSPAEPIADGRGVADSPTITAPTIT